MSSRMRKGQTPTSQVSAARGPGLGAGLPEWGQGWSGPLGSSAGPGLPTPCRLFRGGGGVLLEEREDGERLGTRDALRPLPPSGRQ